ncbi:sensor histidine kinase [Niabella drilacis]|uniref:Histidine kinase n=1 Tax=Niabella drilacis (strain DSM 25811 / CCM 8410 / CCUG 62505 / LMG 26954 / E90) TaxID=1285928 RepID=A0A1G6XZR3_NIADE|nr:histidine kinase [Niabella drilacis]SDD83714.1 Histidine kinase [Niabella drilacis]
MIIKYPILKQWFYWLLAFSLLVFIYSTAYGSYHLGITVILLLLPVHMLYFYVISGWIIPRFYFRSQYVKTFLLVLLTMILVAVLYRVVEVLITDPYIFRFYKSRDAGFTWDKLNLSEWEQLKAPGDFANALERSNTVVWICVTLKLFILWHERKQVVLQAELNFLKGQLHPHFLFNALNNLYALSLDNAPQTPGTILGLSNILRYMLYECAAEQVLLKRDLEVLQDYIELERLRYEDRLELNVSVSDCAGTVEIAPLLMLPLVENAFKYGAAETTDTPWINIELCISGEQLVFKVSNSKPERSFTHNQKPAGAIGLSNLRKRLALLYPGKHKLLCFDEGDCFIAELHVQLSSKNKR